MVLAQKSQPNGADRDNVDGWPEPMAAPWWVTMHRCLMPWPGTPRQSKTRRGPLIIRTLRYFH
jgi:hypothetical protein